MTLLESPKEEKKDVKNILDTTKEWTENPKVNKETDLNELNNITEDEANIKATDVLDNPETETQVNTLRNIMKVFADDTNGKYNAINEEFKKLTENILKSYENKIGDILNKVEDNWSNIDVSSLSPQEAATLSDNIMKNQPQEIREQTKAINNVLDNGSAEHKKILNEVIKTMQKDIEDMYNKIQTIDNKTP